jgi:hypothetical protein
LPATGIVAVGLAGLATHLNVLAVLALVVLVGLLLPARSNVEATLLAAPVLAGGLCVLLTMAAILEVRTDPIWLAAAGLPVLGLLVAQRRQRRPLATREDIAPLAVGALTFLLVARPFIGTSTGRQLAYLSRTTDSGNHLGMIREVMRVGGYFALISGLDDTVMGFAQHYPPAFSGVMGTMLRIVVGRDPSISTFVTAAGLSLAALFAVLAALLTLVSVRMVGPPGSTLLGQSVIALASFAFISFGPAALLMYDAAFAQVLALLAVVACLLVATKQPSGPRVLIAVSALTILGLQAWYLIAPGFIVSWLILLRHSTVRRTTVGVAGSFVAAMGAFCVLLGPGGHYVTTGGFFDLPTEISNVALVLCLLAVITFWARRGETSHLRLPYSATAVVLVLTSALLGLGLLILTGSLSYYFFKTLNGAEAFGCAVLAAGAADLALLLTRSQTRTKLTATLAAVAMAWAPAPAFGGDPLLRNLALGRIPQAGVANGPPLSGSEMGHVLNSVIRDNPRGVHPHHDVWIAGSCSRAQLSLMTKWIYDLSLTWTPGRLLTVETYRRANQNIGIALAARAQDPTVTSMDVYMSDLCDDLALEVTAKIHLHHVPRLAATNSSIRRP